MKGDDRSDRVAAHYDGLDYLYRRLWGEHLHHGLWSPGVDDHQQAAVEMVLEVARRLSPAKGWRICDVGCGYGATGTLLNRNHQVEVTGINLSEAQQRGAVEGSRIIHGDWLENDFEDAEFDALVALESLEHMSCPRKAMTEIVRVLRPGGKVVLCCWVMAEDPSWLERVALLDPIRRSGHLIGMTNERSLSEWMREAGLRIGSVEDRSGEVVRSWSEVVRRGARSMVNSPEMRRFAGSHLREVAASVGASLRIRLAYSLGALRYLIIDGSKPE